MTNFEKNILRNKNVQFLKAHRIDLYNKIADINFELQGGGNTASFHDSSDPWKEAAQLLQAVEQQLRQQDHQVVFFGTGLGYLVRSFTQRFPHISYTIYEPSVQTFLAFLSHFSFEDMNIQMLRNLFVGYDSQRTIHEIKSVIYQIPSNFTILTLPSYQAAYRDLYKQFIVKIDQMVRYKKQQLNVNHFFEKVWVRNSIDNFQFTLDTQSIFNYQQYFCGKPVLLAAAGPSLQEEFENIKKIKQQKSAYIVTVGSAINSFIENKIVPDAAFSYDPSETNYVVFDRAIQENREAFPLVFGTTVGRDTVERFPWSKIHIPINQDSVYNFYLVREHGSVIVQDAPSIAIITLQVLIALQCSCIILAGQNFAYRNGNFYSEGVPYAPDIVSDETYVTSVSGEPVLTAHFLNSMRKEMEYYIKNNRSVEIINTTKEGAAIEGTSYKPLSEVIDERLSPGSINEDWLLHPMPRKVDVAYLLARKEQMLKHYEALRILFLELQQAMHVMKTDQQQMTFQTFDSLFKKLQHNLFFRYFLQPMNRVNYEILYSKIVIVKTESNEMKKAALICSLFGKFLYECYEDYLSIRPQFEKLNRSIEDYISERRKIDEE